MVYWRRVNWKKEFKKPDKENIEYYKQLEMFKMRELICQAVYMCNDEQNLKMIPEVSCASSGMRFVGGSIDKMHLGKV